MFMLVHHDHLFCVFLRLLTKHLRADVSLATGVAEGTIRNSYKDLYPHLSKIVPEWFAQGEDLKNLCSP